MQLYMLLQDLDPDATDSIVNADSDASTVCPDGGDSCDLSELKVCVLGLFVCYCVGLGYC